jgi:Tol biopolymer transport system component
LWRYQDGLATEIWKGADDALFEAPAISLDGKRIAIVLRKLGKRGLHVISADGGEARALAGEIDVEGSSAWSPDGEWIVSGGADEKGPGLFKIPTAGGTPVRLSAELGRNPVWSPDGSLIAYAGPNVFTQTPLLAVKPDGDPVNLPAIRMHRDGERMRFTPDSKGLVYMQAATPWQDFWLLDLATLETRQLTGLNNSATMRTFDISANGREIVFDRLRENSDVVVIDLVGPRG